MCAPPCHLLIYHPLHHSYNLIFGQHQQLVSYWGVQVYLDTGLAAAKRLVLRVVHATVRNPMEFLEPRRKVSVRFHPEPPSKCLEMLSRHLLHCSLGSLLTMLVHLGVRRTPLVGGTALA